MKVLFASCYGCDWIASTLWHGLREVVGPENVWDAAPGIRSLQMVGGEAEQLMGAEAGFDLLVINSCFRRDHNWDWVAGHLGVETKGVPWGRLLPAAKVVYVEGWDSAWDINPPHVPVDLVLRREIDPHHTYPYDCKPTMFAVPEKCFETDDHERPLDVCYMVNAKGIGVRYDAWDAVASLPPGISRRLTDRVEFGAIPLGEYFDALRKSKLCVCPPGGGSDCLRQWEAIALGSIPVFVGHPPRFWEPWFSSDDEIFWCGSTAELPGLIQKALSLDLDARRKKLQENAIKNHTTRARAKYLLQKVGLQ